MAHSSVSTHEPEASRGQHQFPPSIKQLDPLASLLPPEKQINHTVLRLTSGSNTYFLPLDGDDSLWSIARNLPATSGDAATDGTKIILLVSMLPGHSLRHKFAGFYVNQ
jgi:hypothetical protein